MSHRFLWEIAWQIPIQNVGSILPYTEINIIYHKMSGLPVPPWVKTHCKRLFLRWPKSVAFLVIVQIIRCEKLVSQWADSKIISACSEQSILNCSILDPIILNSELIMRGSESNIITPSWAWKLDFPRWGTWLQKQSPQRPNPAGRQPPLTMVIIWYIFHTDKPP